ncbi:MULTISPECIES: 50S ribosomal protein L6 [Nitratiruptor]|uniref:Large ribosomal subunit protein uL6 n=1 Tax=Nitratiruptor tergarcus DSM 16512 TaxID=1069081 RepID=A0A1W1WSA5_9BACT|nr:MULTISPECIES: 50S ribosomal protein L6 [Nitratiruptor]BCD61428.1 large subunit ribosomal protein L6 [Nitratiruptor sp. YY08-13]BCD65362.1 large subunit ribosomal protein L6 [Nitratiruptor sp. YY08-26]SMC08920.1 large subunit ribosomal protein L6 [Nitratiruptor tergarcus DSM 16512]
MSRIGKQPVAIPSGVEVKAENGKLIVKKGNLSQEIEYGNRVNVKIEDNKIVFSPVGEDKQSRAFWGTYRALANNAIEGLTKGFEKKLEINGVGYRAQVKGKELELQLGFSHPINYSIPEGIQISVEKNIISIKGHDKQKVGQVAAEIRSFRPPEPYKGKGVKYVDEVIIRKAGKTAKK